MNHLAREIARRLGRTPPRRSRTARRRGRARRHEHAALVVCASLASLLTLATQNPARGESPDDTVDQATIERAAAAARSVADAPSEVVYPEGVDALTFSHTRHSDVPCTTCHGAALASRRSRDELRPTMATCASCHASGGARPALGDCAGCHRSYRAKLETSRAAKIARPAQWRAVRPAPMTPAKPTPRLRFDHRAHLELLARQRAAATSADGGEAKAGGAKKTNDVEKGDAPGDGDEREATEAERLARTERAMCGTCHSQAANPTGRQKQRANTGEERPEETRGESPKDDGVSAHATREPGMPHMEQCLQCHDGRRADDACTTCHATAGTGRVATKFSAPLGGRAQRLVPSDHTKSWKKRHGDIARSQTDECATCHIEEDCTECHNSTVARPFAVHSPNYVTIHSVAARQDAGDCTDCHQTQTFCRTCHVRSGNVPDRPDAPPARKKFHPPGWLDASMPSHHGVMARRNINDCASCHSEKDCISCHQNIDPHPPRFRMNCGGWLRANPRPCARCHQDLSALKTMCR